MTIADARRGQQQTKLYANCLEKMHGQRPLVYYTRGYTTWLRDNLMYAPREVGGAPQEGRAGHADPACANSASRWSWRR